MDKVVWSTDASNDLIEIYNYISKDSVYYVTKTIYEITKKVENLYNFPYMGKKSAIHKEYEYRELIYKSYKIIYKVKSNTIYILRIWHSARLIDNIFH